MSVPAVLAALPAGAGAIGLLSSDEFQPEARAFDEALLAATGPRVALVLCADPDAAPQSAELGLAHYRALGAEPVVVDVLRRADARAEALPGCDVLFLAGGSPATLLDCLQGTPFWDEALRRWRDGMALAGSSAGAMALCEHCLRPVPGADKPTEWARGLGPLPGVGLAVHASSRPASWLDQVAAAAPCPVVALGDATGVVLVPGAPPRIAGTGKAWVARPA